MSAKLETSLHIIEHFLPRTEDPSVYWQEAIDRYLSLSLSGEAAAGTSEREPL